MSDFEREEQELMHMMGGKFVDMTEANIEVKEVKPEKVEVKKKTSKVVEKTSNAEWHPTKVRTWMDFLKNCAKWVVIFGGLNCLVFYWKQSGLMAESIAIPCMWVCCALAGYGVGLNVWRGTK